MYMHVYGCWILSKGEGPNAPSPPPLNLACTCHGSNSRRLRDFGHMLPNSTLILLSLSLPHAASAQSSLSQLTSWMMMTFTSHVATRYLVSHCYAKPQWCNVPAYCTYAINTYCYIPTCTSGFLLGGVGGGICPPLEVSCPPWGE